MRGGVANRRFHSSSTVRSVQPSLPPGLGPYAWLANLPRPRSYRGKIMLVAFFGTHVPLIALLVYALSRSALPLPERVRVLVVALAATLAGTAATLILLHFLLAPLGATAAALRAYLTERTVPDLPLRFRDEAGVLMADTVKVIRTLDTSLRYLTTHDALTGLPNQARFRERVAAAFDETRREGGTLAVLLLDVDGFAALNSLRGREAGDELLRQLSDRLSGAVRDPDDTARVGGDEFAVLLAGAGGAEEVAREAERILGVLAGEAAVGVSLGVALYPSDAEDPESLLAGAEEALVRAKLAGGGVYRFAAAAHNEALRRRTLLEAELPGAAARGELSLHYQPQIDPATGRTVGAEALMRWAHPRLGAISPMEFIPLAEAGGGIVGLGAWALREACAQARAWQLAGATGFRVAVNLSARQLEEPELVAMVRDTLARTGLDPASLELEVTESAVMSDAEHATRVLRDLRATGVAVSLDDFGTGYSSLGRLVALPITGLKIDQLFVRGLETEVGREMIILAIIALGHQMGLEITAEGVETEPQSAYLRSAGCDRLQGYHLGRPMPAAEMARRLQV